MNSNSQLIQVITIDEAAVRKGSRTTKNLSVQDLSTNINLFIDQVNVILSNAPEKVDKFRLDEIEIHAEITAKGALAILGTGGELSGAGGLRFVFRRGPKANS